MNPKTTTLSAPARIHFGLFSVDGEQENQFGGIGLMIESPSTIVCCKNSETLQIRGLHCQIVTKIVESWLDAFGQSLRGVNSVNEIPLSIEVLSCPPRHSGFGSGTQLALSIATAMFEALELDVPDAPPLAAALNRGRRSAIGSHGFFRGGLLVDVGLTPGDSIASLAQRIDFPADWTIVLAQPTQEPGLHGRLEKLAFEKLASGCDSNREELLRLCNQSIVPAIVDADYAAVGNPLYEFNRKSGEYFAQYQFGCYHSQASAQIVEHVREFGIEAVGQSSWGPCIFAITRDDEQAQELVKYLRSAKRELFDQKQIQFAITKANNIGVRVRNESGSVQTSKLTSQPTLANNK